MKFPTKKKWLSMEPLKFNSAKRTLTVLAFYSATGYHDRCILIYFPFNIYDAVSIDRYTALSCVSHI